MDNMLSNFVDKIIGLKRDEIIDVDQKKYSISKISPILEPIVECLTVSSLRSIVDYVTNNNDGEKYKSEKEILINISSPTEVEVLSNIFGSFKQREKIILAKYSFFNFRFGQFMDYESFIISVQTQFEQNEKLKNFLKFISSVTNLSQKENNDDGISQEVIVKAGVLLKGSERTENPITLTPRRTFPDVQQTPGQFVFRINSENKFGLFESDGGMWQLEAKEAIFKFFDKELSNYIVIR